MNMDIGSYESGIGINGCDRKGYCSHLEEISGDKKQMEITSAEYCENNPNLCVYYHISKKLTGDHI